MEKQRKITSWLAIIYFIVLIWIILFKMQFSFENLPDIRNINLVPFGESVIINGKVDFDEIVNNVIIFIPMGLYINMLKKDWKIGQKIGMIVATSLTLECLQYVFAIGATDITDLITNTCGGMLGLGIYFLMNQFAKTETKTNRILNILAGIGTTLVGLLMILLIIAN